MAAQALRESFLQGVSMILVSAPSIGTQFEKKANTVIISVQTLQTFKFLNSTGYQRAFIVEVTLFTQVMYFSRSTIFFL